MCFLLDGSRTSAVLRGTCCSEGYTSAWVVVGWIPKVTYILRLVFHDHRTRFAVPYFGLDQGWRGSEASLLPRGAGSWSLTAVRTMLNVMMLRFWHGTLLFFQSMLIQLFLRNVHVRERLISV